MFGFFARAKSEDIGGMQRYLVVDLSGRGYGHAAMTIPILNALRRDWPGLRLTIRTTVPRAWLVERLTGNFDDASHADFGMVMADAVPCCAE